jgi:hypothetical protein
MGLKSSPDLEIDRIDNSRGYCEENCRWATDIEQSNNKRNNHLITVDGRVMTVVEGAREANIHPSALHRRITSNWHPDWLLVPFPGMAFWEG